MRVGRKRLRIRLFGPIVAVGLENEGSFENFEGNLGGSGRVLCGLASLLASCGVRMRGFEGGGGLLRSVILVVVGLRR